MHHCASASRSDRARHWRQLGASGDRGPGPRAYNGPAGASRAGGGAERGAGPGERELPVFGVPAGTAAGTRGTSSARPGALRRAGRQLSRHSLDFAVALVAGANADSVVASLGKAAYLYDGFTENLLPDSTSTDDDVEWFVGETGKNGHESCIEPPAGVTFVTDPHCPEKFSRNYGPSATPITREI